jgi:hypothetical protein
VGTAESLNHDGPAAADQRANSGAAVAVTRSPADPGTESCVADYVDPGSPGIGYNAGVAREVQEGSATAADQHALGYALVASRSEPTDAGADSGSAGNGPDVPVFLGDALQIARARISCDCLRYKNKQQGDKR